MAKLSEESGIKDLCYSQAINSHFRPLPYFTTHKRKLQHLDQHQHNTLPQPKGPAYWDNLSTIWLTKGALKELDRRNSYPEPRQKDYRPVTRPFNAKREKDWKPQFAPDFLRDCAPSCLKQLERLSRLGGPDLSDLRNHPEPDNLNEPMGRKRTRAPLQAFLPLRSGASEEITSTTKTGAYSRNFRQHLIDHDIYPNLYEYPGDEKPALPNNWDEINKRLARRRPSLSPSKFSQKDFQKFRQEDAFASKENPVTTGPVPMIEGDRDPKYSSGGYPFGNLDHLTDGTLAQAKPDRFYGARPKQLDLEIRKKLSNQIILSTQDDLPMAPNFFLEAKGPDVTPAIAERQACYYGALGARAIHALQTYQQERPIYDNNAYTIISTYADGQLKLYTTHLTEPKAPGCRPEYIMTQLNTWGLTGNPETFRQGASAYRNARDWAKEKRDEFIRLANERHSNAQAQHSENGRSSQ